mmetsp:Transcript_17545/g.45337  ORF Transcript_17545/g.45337 Transcript_17545/m.45337 type:complete len:312 (+) Transcript_17545:1356-2291(+)
MQIVFERAVQLARGVRLNLGRLRDQRDEGGGELVAHVGARHGEGLDDGVDPPLLLRGELVDDVADLGHEVLLVLRLNCCQVGEHLANKRFDVGLVDQHVDQLERPPAQRHVRVLEAVNDRLPVALHGAHIGGHDGDQRVQRNVADVVVAVAQEAPKDVDCEDTQPRLCFNRDDREHTLVQDRVAHVLRRLGVGRDLGEYVIHLVGALGRARSEHAQQLEQRHLQERVGDAVDIVLGSVPGEHQVLQDAHERGHLLAKRLDRRRIDLRELEHKLDAREQHAVVAVAQHGRHLVDVVFCELWVLLNSAHGTQA